MGIVLGPNQYGKAENRVVRIYRDTERHEIRDVNVSTSLRGDFTAAHYTGDQADVLPTDTQKQTAYAYAKEKGIAEIENYGLDLARHFVGRHRAGDRCPDRGRGVRLGAGQRPQPHLGQEGPGGTAVRRHGRRQGRRPAHLDRLGIQGPGAAEVDGLAVLGLSPGPLHRPAADHGPRDVDLAGGLVALHDNGGRLRRRLRRRQAGHVAGLRRCRVARAAADAL